jgi:hypothetical protein
VVTIESGSRVLRLYQIRLLDTQPLSSVAGESHRLEPSNQVRWEGKELSMLRILWSVRRSPTRVKPRGLIRPKGPVTPVLCFVDTEPPPFIPPSQANDVFICTPKSVSKRLTQRRPYTPRSKGGTNSRDPR